MNVKKLSSNGIEKSKIKDNRIIDSKKVNGLTVEEIIKMEEELAINSNQQNFFLNAKKIDMLDKIANTKLKLLAQQEQMKNKESDNDTAEPIKVEFVSPKTPETMERLERLNREVDESLGNGTDNHA